MRQPVSTITNLAYLVAGLVLMRNGGPVGVVSGLAFAFLGIASGWYHWALSKKAQITDERGMYLCLTISIAAQLYAISPVAGLTGLYVAVLAGVLLSIGAERLDSYWVIPILSLGALLLHGVAVSWESALWLFLGLVGATLIREGHDRSRTLRPYRDLVHGVWHMATALYLFLLTAIPLFE